MLMPCFSPVTGSGGSSCTAWNLNATVYASKSFSTASQITSLLKGVYIGDSGTKMYCNGNSQGIVYQYTLGTAYDVSTASYASKSCDASAQTADPYGLTFSSDGTKMYILGSSSVWQYTLSVAWDVSTATYDSKTFSFGTQETSGYGFYIKPGGTKLYVFGSSGNNTVWQYSISSAGDISTASYDSVSVNTLFQVATGAGLFFSTDGLKMYAVSAGSSTADYVYQYTLSSAWNVGTATYDSVYATIGATAADPAQIYISPDGLKLYVANYTAGQNVVYQFTIC